MIRTHHLSDGADGGHSPRLGQNWRRVLKADPIDWLLEPNNPSVRYHALVDLLDRPINDPAVVQASTEVGRMHTVLYILGRRGRNGLWGGDKDYYTPKHVSTFWSLSILGDLGVGADFEPLQHSIDYMLSHQGDDGAFRRRQITTGRPEDVPNPCTQARILRFLVQFGYGAHPSVRAGIEWLIAHQRDDGAWICAGNAGARHGCLRATHDFLRVASLLPAYREHVATTSAAEWLLNRLLDQRVGRFKVANLWLAFTFPVFDYHLLSAADVLTSLGYGLESPRLAEASRAILDKQTDQGAWLMEVEPAKAPASFGRAGEPNKWVTLDALRVLKRLHSTNVR